MKIEKINKERNYHQLKEGVTIQDTGRVWRKTVTEGVDQSSSVSSEMLSRSIYSKKGFQGPGFLECFYHAHKTEFNII